LSGANSIGRAPEPIPGSIEAVLVVVAVLEVVAAWMVVGIWREPRRSLAYRMAWSAVALMPVVGLILCALWRDPPGPHGPTDRPPGRDWDL